MSQTPNDTPRPSSLRALLAWFFALSFGDYQDKLEHSVDKDDRGEDLADKEQSPFARRLRHLVWWPPDIFALTSVVLSRTGAYRMIVGPYSALGQDLWHRLDWQIRVEAYAEAWRSTISKLVLEPIPEKIIKDKRNDKRNRQSIADEMLWNELRERIKERCERRHLEQSGIAVPKSVAAAQASISGAANYRNLMDLFLNDIKLGDDDGAFADQNLLAVSVKADRRNRPGSGDHEKNAAKFFEAIIGLHILADAASASIGVPRSSTQESSVFVALANIMLTLRGSLSNAAKFHGVVLPKMRTPQAGLTLRNLSHNLTFHDCEVEVMWRSFPWANFDENTLNVLYVPYPFDFKPDRFEGDTAHHESVGYFTYKPEDWKEVSRVVELIEEIRAQGIQPHMLVFTETAFNEDTYKRLLTALSNRYSTDDPQRMPVVVAGIAKEVHDLPYNELRLATYFAGKWYQLSQHKHHRWQLNDSQIRQYGLQGRLPAARPLFERSVIDQRRLTFYAPAPWLVLSPLICEDLSRIEPVSELIRGVGPTLVLALLLDGPQLAERWPGRYASVLADDPGTGVLTVTSYGMAKVSSPTAPSSFSCTKPETDKASVNEEVVVASWKGPRSSFQKLSASKDQALLITLTAEMGEEFTLDRRGLTGKAAGFRLDGVKAFNMPPSKGDKGIDTRLDLGNWSDIREVTAVTYVASAALSLLRPHLSKHPVSKIAKKRTDTWNQMPDWGNRCKYYRQLIDVMLGRPLFWAGKHNWEDSVKEEAESIKGTPAKSQYDYFNELRATRNLLLNHIFREAANYDDNNFQLHELAPNRHIFAVLGFSQSTIDVEVRDDEAVWPTDALRFGGTVLRFLLDSIAGVDYLDDGLEAWEKGQEVYSLRLKIAARANRNRPVLWGQLEVDVGARDVKGAPKPLYVSNATRPSGEGTTDKINYLHRFGHLHNPNSGKTNFPAKNENPNRYDFYRMVLELVYAIVLDEEASLWKRCRKEFEGHVNEAEMHRLTLLVLMMLPGLIHEQLEFDYIRLKQTNEMALNSNVMHNLIKLSEDILTNAAKKTRRPWNPRKTR